VSQTTIITDGIARWNTAERHRVRVTDTDGGLLDWYLIAVPGNRPGIATLWNTGWYTSPGSQWREDDNTPGSWSCPVFRLTIGSGRRVGR
jgi:hypothetical protein